MPAPSGATTLIEAVWRLEAAKIELVDVALRRPSLDEVFLSLTEDSAESSPPGPLADRRDVMTVPTGATAALRRAAVWVLTIDPSCRPCATGGWPPRLLRR